MADFRQNIPILTIFPLSFSCRFFVSKNEFIWVTILFDLASAWIVTAWKAGIDFDKLPMNGQWYHKNLKNYPENYKEDPRKKFNISLLSRCKYRITTYGGWGRILWMG